MLRRSSDIVLILKEFDARAKGNILRWVETRYPDIDAPSRIFWMRGSGGAEVCLKTLSFSYPGLGVEVSRVSWVWGSPFLGSALGVDQGLGQSHCYLSLPRKLLIS